MIPFWATVAGIVALMLEVTPYLSWRDVQGILASSAKQLDATDDSWTTNAVGVSHSNKYGFGIVDAGAAVTAARNWKLWGEEIAIEAESGPQNTLLPDNVLLTSAIGIADPRNLTIESVVVYLDISHQSIGDLKISLTTLGGNESVLTPGKRPLNQQLDGEQRWKFLTYAAWGERVSQNYTLTIADERPGTFNPGGTDLTSVENIFRSWSIIVYAHDVDEKVTIPPTPAPGSDNPGGSNSSVNSNATAAAPTLAPGALSQAIMATISPNISNAPFITWGDAGNTTSSCSACWASVTVAVVNVAVAVMLFWF